MGSGDAPQAISVLGQRRNANGSTPVRRIDVAGTSPATRFSNRPAVILTSFNPDENNESPQNSASNSAVLSRAEDLLKLVARPKDELRRAWHKALRDHKVAPDVLAEALFRLHETKQHESVIEGIESAIRNNKGQPWMYNALVQELRIAERPQAEIDRALLSRVDFAAGNEAQLLVTVALLSRFDAFDQAIELLKEGIRRNPYQPATWGMARSLAEKSGNPDHMIWSHTGSLKHVWDGEHKVLHKQLLVELEKLEQTLKANGKPEKASEVREAIAESQIRDLRILIRWSGKGDVDLSVEDPDGNVCSYKTPMTPAGGMLVAQSDGLGDTAEEFVAVRAKSGTYKVRVKFIAGRVIRGQALMTVIRHENTPREQKQSARINIGSKDAEIPVELKSGRSK